MAPRCALRLVGMRVRRGSGHDGGDERREERCNVGMRGWSDL